MTSEPTQTASKEKNGTARPSYINYRLKSEVSIMLSAVCSTHYTAVQLFEKHLCNQSSHYENTDNFHYEGKPSRATAKSTPFVSAKMNGTQRRTLVSP